MLSPPLHPAAAPKLRSLIQICDMFQEAAGPTVPLALVEAFLLVCLYEGASLKDLCRLAGQAQSTLSRQLLDLADAVTMATRASNWSAGGTRPRTCA